MEEPTIKPVSLFDKKPTLFNITASVVEDHKPIGINNYSLEFIIPPSHRQFTHYEFYLRTKFNVEKLDGASIPQEAKVAIENNINGCLFSTFTCKINNSVIQSDQNYWLKHYLLTLFRNNKTIKETYLRAANVWFPDGTDFTDGTVCKCFIKCFKHNRMQKKQQLFFKKFTATNPGYVFRRGKTELSQALTVFDKIELDCSSGKRFFLPGLLNTKVFKTVFHSL